MDAGELSFRMGFLLSQKPHLAAGGGGLKAYRTRLANVVTWAGASGGVRLALSNRDGKGEAEARCLHGRRDGSVVRGEREWQSEQGNLGWLRGFLISRSMGREKGK